ncbi:hypothetical protein BJX64DRAFT_251001 [Aspergillus heterothallicus]
MSQARRLRVPFPFSLSKNPCTDPQTLLFLLNKSIWFNLPILKANMPEPSWWLAFIIPMVLQISPVRSWLHRLFPVLWPRPDQQHLDIIAGLAAANIHLRNKNDKIRRNLDAFRQTVAAITQTNATLQRTNQELQQWLAAVGR